MWFLPKWVEAIWEVISKLAKLVWVALVNGWGVILATVTALKYVFDAIRDAITTAGSHMAALWAVLTDSVDGMKTALASGWPSELAGGVGFINSFVPVTEALVMAATLITTYLVCTLCRVIKSFLPSIN